MSISPINFNGMIQNTNEIGHTQAAEDQKPIMQQANLTDEVAKQQEQQAKQVNTLNKSEKTENKYDREGSGKGYTGNKNQNKNQKEKDEKLSDGKVVEKNFSSFDMRV